MVKLGMMIGERYEILEKIGTGGMSDVYKAKCHKLNRFVAVKVLKQEFSENANFVSKFRIEAQAAAGLMHPNIVNVYDVGEEGGIYYIVMELVEGITLKKYIEKKARLSYKEAVSIAIQVSMGIEAAHNNHIIHRDIKPQNIIISKEGKVKVTDFGIAKAATSNTITSNVMGSVHYTSPEQARGGYSDEKSDIYSLGITLFEMLTGRVPFNGETTVAIAIKHIQEEMVSPKEFVPEIPRAVEAIVMKCCQKSPSRRYQNMQELIHDLKLSLMNPDEDLTQTDEEADGETRAVSESEIEEIKQRTGYGNDGVKEDTMRLKTEVTEGVTESENADNSNKMEKITTILAAVFGVIILVLVIVIILKMVGSIKKNPPIVESSTSPIQTSEAKETKESKEEAKMVTMPEVAGKMVEQARNELTALGIFTEVDYQESDVIKAGEVISADVTAGAEIEVGCTITLTASAGPQGIAVENVVGKTFADANATLISQGFTVTKMEAYSETVEAGIVASQTPGAGNKIAKNSNITLTVSLGKEDVKVRVPNLCGLTEQDATIEAIEAGLQIGTVSYVYNTDYVSGLICWQGYGHGVYVNKDTAIDIKISQGAAPQTKTYKYNGFVTAPTTAEAPDYTEGQDYSIVLTAEGGDILLETKTNLSSYPLNFSNLKSEKGTITITYEVTTEAEKDEEGNVVKPGSKETKSFTREITFVQEN